MSDDEEDNEEGDDNTGIASPEADPSQIEKKYEY